jgi:hypothetical protein
VANEQLDSASGIEVVFDDPAGAVVLQPGVTIWIPEKEIKKM